MIKVTPVLIAGAGWRVSTFVMPALLCLGVPRDDIAILRRRLVEPEGILAGIHVVDRIEALAGRYALTINCASRDALVDVQCRLINRFPDAIHFCDTPIFNRWSDLLRVIRLATVTKLFSLEDWPTMPNLKPMLDLCAKSPNLYQLRFEHIGIATHFLSVARRVAAVANLSKKRFVTREGQVLTDRPIGADAICVHKGPKDVARSKIIAWNGSQLIEDFFEVRHEAEPPGPVADEVVYRRVEGEKLRYLLGNSCFREVRIPEQIMALFLSHGTRFAIHELDKCISLVDILGRALEGNTTAYSYLQSTNDAVAGRFAQSKLGIALAL